MCFKFAIDWYRSNDWLGVILAVGGIVLIPIVAYTEGNARANKKDEPHHDND